MISAIHLPVYTCIRRNVYCTTVYFKIKIEIQFVMFI